MSNKFENALITILFVTIINQKLCFGLEQKSTQILTREVHITSYEHHTVTLPCEIENLPTEMPVIWQYGKRKEINQTVLTIGGTQLENNYRLRVITNSTDDKFGDLGNKVTIHNLEIRKLQSQDSGWYECQLPTKPTQINYVHLEVLTLPRIEVSSKNARFGESFELVCQVKNLPKRFELNWYFNDRKLIFHPLNINEESKMNKFERRNSYESVFENKSFLHVKKKPEQFELFTVTHEKFQNITQSRLKIRDLNEHHKGIFKCKYDRVEAKYQLDFKFNPKARLQNDDEHLFSKGVKLNVKNVFVSIFLLMFIIY